MTSRESAGRKDSGPRRVMDDAGRRRRARKALEALEQDNYHEDPHANLVMSKKAPKFEEALEGGTRSAKDRKRKTRTSEYLKQRYRKNFSLLLEEEQLYNPDGPNYLTAQAGESRFPERHLCAVCGFPSPYSCVVCGARFCTTRCLTTHQDTRCLKYTA